MTIKEWVSKLSDDKITTIGEFEIVVHHELTGQKITMRINDNTMIDLWRKNLPNNEWIEVTRITTRNRAYFVQETLEDIITQIVEHLKAGR